MAEDSSNNCHVRVMPEDTRSTEHCLRLLETTNTVLSQRVQYVYSVLAISDPKILATVDWQVQKYLVPSKG